MGAGMAASRVEPWAPARGACLRAWVGLGRLLFALFVVVAAFSLSAAMLR